VSVFGARPGFDDVYDLTVQEPGLLGIRRGHQDEVCAYFAKGSEAATLFKRLTGGQRPRTEPLPVTVRSSIIARASASSGSARGGAWGAEHAVPAVVAGSGLRVMLHTLVHPAHSLSPTAESPEKKKAGVQLPAAAAEPPPKLILDSWEDASP